ncbi:hypothetical protein ACHQM5_022211 [Ranunculus cassubicifolius]
METINFHHQQPIRRPIIINNPANIQTVWAMRNLCLQGVSIKHILLRKSPNLTHRFPPPHHQHQRLKVVATMADTESKQQPEESIDLKKKESEEKLPPAPEKPLPGDCCGNGCTPCVWDQYYEEHELNF